MKKLPSDGRRSRPFKPPPPVAAPLCQQPPPMDRQAQTLLGRRLDRIFAPPYEERLPESLGTMLADVEMRLKNPTAP